MNVNEKERRKDAEADALKKSAEMRAGELLAALKKGDLNAPALFAQRVIDWDAPIPCGAPKLSRPTRFQTVGEVAAGYICEDVTFDLFLGFVIAVAYGSDADMPAKARKLLEGVAQRFGDESAELAQ